jgi:carboxyl-terminal processing protease
MNENDKEEKSFNPDSHNGKLLVFYPLLLAAMLATGVYFGSFVSVPPAGTKKESVTKITNLLNVIDDYYVEEIDRKDLTENAIRDILMGLDPHSAYMTPEDAIKAREDLSGNFGGVGIQFLVHKDTLVVTHLIEGGPSAEAGLLPFDRIVSVDGTSMAGKEITTEDVFKKLRGPVGTDVELTIFRRGRSQLQTYKITRGMIPVSTVEASLMLDSETGFIKLSQFGESTHRDFLTAVNRLQNRGMKRVILDLRDNGGGYLKEANSIADEFLTANQMIVYTEGKNSPKSVYKSTSKGKLHDAQVIVLMNHNSASASEIVAGAIQDNDRGLILGRRSFGKGLVQQEFEPFGDGSSIRLTVARYYTPTGRCIQKPYGEGINYENEQLERYEHNEFFVPDSSILVDSLRKTTPGGKVVYGGGGIMPDIFVPLDTTGRSEFYTKLLYDRVFSEYAFDYVENHRKEILRYKSPGAFADQWLVPDAAWNGLISYAAKKKISGSDSEKSHSRELIMSQFKAEVARLVWNADGFYSVISRRDMDVRKAMEQFSRMTARASA